MSYIVSREELEVRLRAELDDAERRLRSAMPKERTAALERFKQALERFSDLVVRGVTPADMRS